jgi:hypothetical protein
MLLVRAVIGRGLAGEAGVSYPSPSKVRIRDYVNGPTRQGSFGLQAGGFWG